jgi:UDP-GlcNAc:undecaprenyl-phosphate GlcNAc-1-phosphate transferase
MNIFSSEMMQQIFLNHYLLFAGLLFLGAFIINYLIIPKVIWVIHAKELATPVISRSAHKFPVPSFAGVAFFITLVIVLSLVQSILSHFVGNNLIAGLTVLFMVGLKDDLVISTAKAKIIGQLISIAFILFLPELQITSLHGFLNIYDIPVYLGLPIAFFLMLSIINAYNLIDGIDGLAGIIGIIICIAYSIIFFFTKRDFSFLVSISIVAILIAFLRYNLSAGTNKIFMGDSGSLIIGYLIGFLTLRFLTIDSVIIPDYQFNPENRIAFIIAILCIPIFDTSRITISRLLKKQSPFIADRNHVHHILIDFGFSHIKASAILGILNISIIVVFLFLEKHFSGFAILFIMFILFMVVAYFFFVLKRRIVRI